MNHTVKLLVVAVLCSSSFGSAQAWQAATGPLQTRWTKLVSPQNDHPEYPRPQMVRKEWLNLNGVWGFEITTTGAQPTVFGTEILVPFPVESALSGVMKHVGEQD